MYLGEICPIQKSGLPNNLNLCQSDSNLSDKNVAENNMLFCSRSK